MGFDILISPWIVLLNSDSRPVFNTDMIKRILGSNFFQLAVLTLAVVPGMLWPFYPLDHLESRYHDLWASRFTIGESPLMAMVAIDDKSLQAIGAWPWPRSLVAQTIESDKPEIIIGKHNLIVLEAGSAPRADAPKTEKSMKLDTRQYKVMLKKQ